jgi:hypothetical protein
MAGSAKSGENVAQRKSANISGSAYRINRDDSLLLAHRLGMAPSIMAAMASAATYYR